VDLRAGLGQGLLRVPRVLDADVPHARDGARARRGAPREARPAGPRAAPGDDGAGGRHGRVRDDALRAPQLGPRPDRRGGPRPRDGPRRAPPRDPAKCEECPIPAEEGRNQGGPDASRVGRFERSPVLPVIFAALGFGALVLGFRTRGLAFIDLYMVPFAFLFAGMLLHGSAISY